MPDFVVRDVDEMALARLEERARSHGCYLEVELKCILAQAAKQTEMASARELAERMSRTIEGRRYTDSAALLREDRDRSSRSPRTLRTQNVLALDVMARLRRPKRSLQPIAR
jgi:plasmid stability protein